MSYLPEIQKSTRIFAVAKESTGWWDLSGDGAVRIFHREYLTKCGVIVRRYRPRLPDWCELDFRDVGAVHHSPEAAR